MTLHTGSGGARNKAEKIRSFRAGVLPLKADLEMEPKTGLENGLEKGASQVPCNGLGGCRVLDVVEI